MARPFLYLQYIPQLVEMYNERDLPLSKIEEITGIPSRTITRILKRKGIKMKPRGNPKKRY